MDIAEERSLATPLVSATLFPLLLLSLTRQRYKPITANTISAEYDYIIVGAGSAGSVVASRLSEKPCVSVLLLEAGKPPPLLSEVPGIARALWYSDIDWKYRTAPQKYAGDNMINRQVVWPSGKTLGGSSVLNAMLYVRGNRKNYDDWAADGAEGWSYKDVLPYFKKLEDNRDPEYVANGFHGVGGPQTVHRPRYQPEIKDPIFQAAKELGYDVVDPNGARQNGFYDLQAFLRSGQRCSTAKAYLVPAENRTNLDILPNAMVRKVLIKNRRAVGVQFDFQGTTYEVKARKEVIMSAGTVNTAQLLMLSGIGPRKELKRHKIPVVADLPVGLNLQDHVGSTVNFLVNPIIEPLIAKVVDSANIAQYIRNRTGPLGSSEFCSVLAFLNKNTRPKKDNPNFELYFAEATSEIYLQLGVTPQAYDQVFAPYTGKPFYLCISHVLQPRSRGTVTLNSKDPYDPPVIDPNYFEDPKDLQDVVDGLKVCNRIGNSAALRKVGSTPFKTLIPGCEKLVGDEDAYLWCSARSLIGTLNHQVGTARMGNPKDPRTVVDPHLRVLSIKGLRVVDASVMPIIPSGNTNAPTIMVAEKASDIIKKSIKCHGEKEGKEWEESKDSLNKEFPTFSELAPFDSERKSAIKDWKHDLPESPWSEAVERVEVLSGKNKRKNIPKFFPWNKEIPDIVPWNQEILFNPTEVLLLNTSTSNISNNKDVKNLPQTDGVDKNQENVFGLLQTGEPASQSLQTYQRAPNSQFQNNIKPQESFPKTSKLISDKITEQELIKTTVNRPKASNNPVSNQELQLPQQDHLPPDTTFDTSPPLRPIQDQRSHFSSKCDEEFCSSLLRFMHCKESISCRKRKQFAAFVYRILCSS